MRTHNIFMTCLATALVSMGAAQAESIGEPYYNPANSASETGKTIGSNLYKTIGCPGRGLLDPACQEDAPVLPVVTVAAPVPAPEPAEAPALPAVTQATAAPTETPVAVASAPATSPAVTSDMAASQPGNINFQECYTNLVKTTADNFRNSAAVFFKATDAGQQ
ncbi:MAG: hypothetical protein PHX10_04065 [Gallionellaceae bacterium]|nr:hypothetical protein [Gallionellaceae bacterium]